MVSYVYLLSKTNVTYIYMRVLQRRFIRFLSGILLELVLFIFFRSYVFYEKLSCKQNAFSVINTSIQTVKIISEMWSSVVFDGIISLCFVYSKNNRMNLNNENSKFMRRFA